MKNLANCTPREFLAQTNKIRKVAKDWLDKTKVLDIRQEAPDLTGLTPSQKKKALREQASKNLSKMLDAVLEKYPDETIELLCLVCFVDPKDADNHSMSEFLAEINSILSDDNVIGFFSSLVSLGSKTTPGSSAE